MNQLKKIKEYQLLKKNQEIKEKKKRRELIRKRRKGLHGPIEVNNEVDQDDFDDELPDDQSNDE